MHPSKYISLLSKNDKICHNSDQFKLGNTRREIDILALRTTKKKKTVYDADADDDANDDANDNANDDADDNANEAADDDADADAAAGDDNDDDDDDSAAADDDDNEYG